jgi:cytochrome P450
VPSFPPHVQPFYDVEAHSMLELEPPRHTRLRGLVLRAFTSRRINALRPEVEALCDRLIDGFPRGPFDLLDVYGRVIPVIVIARLLGVPEDRAPDLLGWSNAMVAMYQARRTRTVEDHAVEAALAFRAFVEEVIAARRRAPGDDLLSHLIAAEEDGQRLSTDEMVATVILLLNAGHEATVHTIGNGVRALLMHGVREVDERVVEEVIRWDPPLHMFTRWAYEEVEAFGHTFRRGDQVACLLAAANRDPAAFEWPGRFDPARQGPANVSFGGGIHFCVGAPLARLELVVAFRRLFERCPALNVVEEPRFADAYHFHGLERLMVEAR